MRNSFSGRAGAAAGAAGRFFGRHPLLRRTLVSFLITLPVAGAALAALYGVMSAAGVYTAVESALNLKHNSPWILWPMYFLICASCACAVAGWLFFRHRYKRPKSDSAFSRTFSVILEETSARRPHKA